MPIPPWNPSAYEPDRDPETGSFIPCAVCGMSQQIGGTGVCSPGCHEALYWDATIEQR